MHDVKGLQPTSCICQNPMPRPDPVHLRGVSLDCSCCPPLSLRCLPPEGLRRPPSASGGTIPAAGWAAPWLWLVGCCWPKRVRLGPSATCLPPGPTGTALAGAGPAGREDHVDTACGN